MFLIDVISSDSIVRTVSARSRMASVVSLKDDMQSTTTRSWDTRSASIMRLAPCGVMSSAISGDGGASSTRMPAEWLMRNVSSDSVSPLSSSGMRSATDLFLGLRLSRTPTSPNWNEASTRHVRWPSSVAAATARLTARVVRPTPPLGPNTATTRPGSLSVAGLRAWRPWPPARRRRGGLEGDPGELVALAGVDLPDGRRQLVGGEGLDQELARAGQHGPAEVVRLALHGHHHDGRGRDLGRQVLRGGDAVHVRHVDVHEDDVGRQPRGHLECLAPGRRRSRRPRCPSRSRAASRGDRGSPGCRRR